MTEPEAPAPERGPWPWLAVLAAGLELACAIWAWVAGLRGSCPELEGWSCAALVRPRLAALGPLSISDLAPLGALLTLAACLVLARSERAGLRRGAALLIGTGAGLAGAAQALSLSAVGALCPICAAVALSALGAAICATLGARPSERRWLVGAAVAALVLASPLAVARGRYLVADDARRRAALAEAGGEAGPRLVLVTRAGCPFCEALELDVLGDPEVLGLLAQTRGLERIPEDDPLAQAHAGGRGAPVLLLLDAPRGEETARRLGRLRGLRPRAEVAAFLRAGLAAAEKRGE